MHIVFQDEDALALAKSFELDATLEAPVITIQDDFSLGPIFDEFDQNAIDNRISWWRELSAENVPPKSFIDQLNEITGALEKNDQENVWIWVAPNKRDVAGYYALIAHLRHVAARLQVIFLNNLPFINEKGAIFYPDFLLEIPPAEFVKAKKLVRPVSPTEIELDPDEWHRLCNDEKNIRTYEGGKKLISRPDEFYDSTIRESIGNQWQKGIKAVQSIQTKCKMKQSENFLSARIRKLVSNGLIEEKGDILNKKEWELKKMDAILKDE